MGGVLGPTGTGEGVSAIFARAAPLCEYYINRRVLACEVLALLINLVDG